MEIQLNNDLINSVNNRTMYNRGTHIQDSANYEYNKFVEHYSNKDYNNTQLQMLEKRKLVFKDFLIKSYNEILSMSSNHVSVMVAGPAGYDAKKYNKILNRITDKQNEIDSKIVKFYDNTDKMLKNCYSKFNKNVSKTSSIL